MAPSLKTARGDTISRTLHIPTWNDVVELDSAVAQNYVVPTGARLLMIQPMNQTTGQASAIYMNTESNDSAYTSSVGGAFTNQPANDGVEMVSSEAADTTQTITIYYTRNGAGDTVSSETKTLNGTNQVAFTDIDIELVLGVFKSEATTGTVTLREASANQTITTLAPTALTSGVSQPTTAIDAYDKLVRIVASGATTKQVGLIGTSTADAALADSQALSGTTAVFSNSAFGTITYVLVGDIENTVTVTLATNMAIVPTADDTTGSNSFPVAGTAMFEVGGGEELSFIRAGSDTVNVCLSSWKDKHV